MKNVRKVLAAGEADAVFDAVVRPSVRSMSTEERAVVMAAKAVHDARWAYEQAERVARTATGRLALRKKELAKAAEAFKRAQAKIEEEADDD